jgi:mRNA-capping enzyme
MITACQKSSTFILKFLASVKSQKRKIVPGIDLTNTSRFYDKEILQRAECEYVKLNYKGYGKTPDSETVNTFIYHCSCFIQTNPLDIIGVHCTHGFNRIAYLIVSYLVQRLDWSVEAAVKEFAQVRPPGI